MGTWHFRERDGGDDEYATPLERRRIEAQQAYRYFLYVGGSVGGKGLSYSAKVKARAARHTREALETKGWSQAEIADAMKHALRKKSPLHPRSR